jgi:hypothetical protein
MKPESLPAKAQALFAERKVLHGPFAGLKYPELRSAGSALYPKLLGSYESEIQPWIREICNSDYSEIVDVGCAEGYYAVGLARAIPGAKVYAYDVSPKAQQLCAACASANHVSDRVTVRGRFEVNDLLDIHIRQRGLLICDCEGEEIRIFSNDLSHAFSQWDIILETHDFIDINISTTLTALFRDTHEMRTLSSIDDIQKAKTYTHLEIASFDLNTRRMLLAECRPSIMEWMFLTSRGTRNIRTS